MKSRRQIEREAKHLLHLCIVEGSVDGTRVHLVVQGVLRSQHRGYLVLLARFMHLLRYMHANQVARIESAVPLHPDLRDQLQTRLAALYGSGLTFSFLPNPELIGGVRIRVASDVYDSSVRSALVTLAKSFGLSDANGLTERLKSR